jgi:hypothetical protein
MSVRESIALALAFSAATMVQARELASPPPPAGVAEFIAAVERLRESLPDASARLAFVVERPGSAEDGYRCQLVQYALAPHIVSCVGLGERPAAPFLLVGGLPESLAALMGASAGFPKISRRSGSFTLLIRE